MKFRMLMSALLFAACLAFTAGCGNNSASGSKGKAGEARELTPQEKVAAEFFKAYVAGDADAAMKFVSMSEEDKARLASRIKGWAEWKKQVKSDRDKSWIKAVDGAKIGKTTVTGDTATVTLVYSFPTKNGGTQSDERDGFQLKLIDGKWLITDYDIKH